MTANLPEPVNQFNRLIHVSGVPLIGYYTIGSRWNCRDSENCTAAMGAMLRDAVTGGRQKSTPCQIRSHQNDTSGGIGWDDVNVAWRSLWNDTLLLPQAADWADVLTYLRQGRPVGIQGDYDQVPYQYQMQKGGTFDHAFGLFGYRASDSKVLRFDPLGHSANWVPQSAIRGAAEKLALVQRGTRSRLFVAIGDPMPAAAPTIPPVTYRYGGEPRFRGRYLCRENNVPVRQKPDPKATKIAELDYRQSFAARQSVGDGRWLGNADGTHWVWREKMWLQGHIIGNETIE